MFFGKFNHNIDEKNRLLIPSKMKLEKGEKVYLLRGFDGCLSLYREPDFENYIASLNQLAFTHKQTRDIQRLGYSSIVEIEIDKLGRISIPTDTMKEFSIEKSVVIVGVYNHIEIWNKTAWEKYEDENSSKYEEIAENLPL